MHSPPIRARHTGRSTAVPTSWPSLRTRPFAAGPSSPTPARGTASSFGASAGAPPHRLDALAPSPAPRSAPIQAVFTFAGKSYGKKKGHHGPGSNAFKAL